MIARRTAHRIAYPIGPGALRLVLQFPTRGLASACPGSRHRASASLRAHSLLPYCRVKRNAFRLALQG